MAPKTSLRPVTREDAAKKAAAAKRAKRTAQVKAQQNQMVEAAEGKAGSSVGDRDRRAKDTFNFMLKNSKGGKVAKKAVGGAMKKKGMAKGGAVTKKRVGGGLTMVKNKAGKMVPSFAADGVGKSAAGGKVAKKMGGGPMKKKGMAKGGAVAKKMGGGKMMKKGYAKGGAVTKKRVGGKMATKGAAKGGTFARGSGAARPQRFRKNG